MVRSERNVGVDTRHERVRVGVLRWHGHLVTQQPFLTWGQRYGALVEHEGSLIVPGIVPGLARDRPIGPLLPLRSLGGFSRV
jgi:hypothetical protein